LELRTKLKNRLFAALPLVFYAQAAIAQDANKTNGYLYGSSSVFDLQTKQEDVLAPNSNRLLNGKAEQTQSSANSKLLQGGAEELASPVTSIQRKGSTLLPQNLKYLTPTISPSDQKQLQAEINRARRTEFGKIDPNSARLLQSGVSKKSPNLDIDLFSAIPKLAPPNMLGSQLALPKSLHNDVSRAEEEELQRAMRHANSNVDDIPGFGRANEVPNLNIDAEISGAKRFQQIPSDDIDLQIDKQKAVRQQSVPDIDAIMKSQLARSKPAMDADLARAKTELQSVFRRITPNEDLAVNGRLKPSNVDSENSLCWDEWYKTVARLVEPLLLKELERRGDPSGANSVSITVWPNHRLAVQIVRGRHNDFDAATIHAYRSLDGNPLLAYPKGSLRPEVTFVVDNKHEVTGAISGVNTKPFVGDFEYHH